MFVCLFQIEDVSALFPDMVDGLSEVEVWKRYEGLYNKWPRDKARLWVVSIHGQEYEKRKWSISYRGPGWHSDFKVMKRFRPQCAHAFARFNMVVIGDLTNLKWPLN